MKATGIVRKLDDLGRLTIPMEIRRTHGWKEREAVEVFLSGEGIVLRKFDPPTEEKNRILNNLIALQFKTDDHDTLAAIKEAIAFVQKK